MPSLLPHSLSLSSFPGSQLGLLPKPFLLQVRVILPQCVQSSERPGQKKSCSIHCMLQSLAQFIILRISTEKPNWLRGYFQLLVEGTSAASSASFSTPLPHVGCFQEEKTEALRNSEKKT